MNPFYLTTVIILDLKQSKKQLDVVADTLNPGIQDAEIGLTCPSGIVCFGH